MCKRDAGIRGPNRYWDKGSPACQGPICTLIMKIMNVNNYINSGYTMGKAKRQGGIMLNGTEFQIYEMKKFSSEISCTIMCIYLIVLNCTLKNG